MFLILVVDITIVCLRMIVKTGREEFSPHSGESCLFRISVLISNGAMRNGELTGRRLCSSRSDSSQFPSGSSRSEGIPRVSKRRTTTAPGMLSAGFTQQPMTPVPVVSGRGMDGWRFSVFPGMLRPTPTGYRGAFSSQPHCGEKAGRIR